MSGYCYMVFHVWEEDGHKCTEVLEYNAGENGFIFFSKNQYDKRKEEGNLWRSRPTDDWYSESWSDSGYKEEIADSIAQNMELDEGEDRYVEFVGDYKITSTRDYWGEYDQEEEVFNDRYQVISQEEYDKWNVPPLEQRR